MDRTSVSGDSRRKICSTLILTLSLPVAGVAEDGAKRFALGNVLHHVVSDTAIEASGKCIAVCEKYRIAVNFLFTDGKCKIETPVNENLKGAGLLRFDLSGCCLLVQANLPAEAHPAHSKHRACLTYQFEEPENQGLQRYC